MMTSNYCMRKYNERIFAVFCVWLVSSLHQWLVLKRQFFCINICCFIITVLSGLFEWCQDWYHSITEPLLDERISEISYTYWIIAYFCQISVSCGRIFCHYSTARPKKTLLGARRYFLCKLNYSIFWLKFRCHGNRGRSWWNLSDIVQ